MLLDALQGLVERCPGKLALNELCDVRLTFTAVEFVILRDLDPMDEGFNLRWGQ